MSSIFLKFFSKPLIITLLVFIIIWFYSGTQALFLVAILSILEITLSFDNAVINAKILEKMNPIWQKRFLTWGIIVAVIGTRFLLPIIIVSVALFMSPVAVAILAFTAPEKYGELLEGVKSSITSFGGIFLLLVSLKYFLNQAKSVHWIEGIECYLARCGNMKAIEIIIALIVLIGLSTITHFDQSGVLVAGLIGLILFITMDGIVGSISIEPKQLTSSGLVLFIYLNIFDSAFSLDGVVGAFAISSNLIIIMTGLGIGAYFVRSLTLYIVTQKTLTHLIYLEQGAHWAIFGLAVSMLANLIIHVPTTLTGLIGLACIGLAYQASIKAVRKNSVKHKLSL